MFLILLIILIFYFSSKPASDSLAQSSFVANIINKYANIPVITPIILDNISQFAHYFEYFILGLYISHLSKKHAKITVFLWIFLVPFMDEGLQYFVPGRCSSISDVIIDIFGIVCGIIVFKLVDWINFLFVLAKKILSSFIRRFSFSKIKR